jgi:hypothetical protein
MAFKYICEGMYQHLPSSVFFLHICFRIIIYI